MTRMLQQENALLHVDQFEELLLQFLYEEAVSLTTIVRAQDFCDALRSEHRTALRLRLHHTDQPGRSLPLVLTLPLPSCSVDAEVLGAGGGATAELSLLLLLSFFLLLDLFRFDGCLEHAALAEARLRALLVGVFRDDGSALRAETAAGTATTLTRHLWLLAMVEQFYLLQAATLVLRLNWSFIVLFECGRGNSGDFDHCMPDRRRICLIVRHISTCANSAAFVNRGPDTVEG